MDCQRAQDEILESFIEPLPASRQGEIDAHVAGCKACAAFAAKQRVLDERLTALLVSPSVRPQFRAAVHERVRQERRIFWSDLLPDAVHFASCAAVTIAALVWLPVSAPAVLAVAAAGTVLAHMVLNAAHDSLDAAEERSL